MRLTGGREVSGWRPVTDSAVLDRLPAEARGQVVVADLRAQGITDFGQLSVRGFSAGNPTAEAELFYDDQPMTLARWPNDGFRGAKSKDGDLTVVVDTDRVGRWSAETEPWVFAYWHHDWAELYEPLAGVDPARQALLRTEKVKPVYGVTPSRARWYAFNLLAELDTPGEYYLDRTGGRLYFWPPRAGGRTVLSVSEGLIRGENLSHVTFRGFILEACRATAIALKGGEDCHVVGCTIRNTGQRAVTVSDGNRHEVYGCDVYFTGAGGLSLSGGQRPTLTPAGHNAENNHVHHYARRARTYHPAITISGVGNRIAHNLVHDGPHMALVRGRQRPCRRVQRDPQRGRGERRRRGLLRGPRLDPARQYPALQLLAPDSRQHRLRRDDHLPGRPALRPYDPRQFVRALHASRVHRRGRRQRGDEQCVPGLLESRPPGQPRHGLAKGRDG